MNIIIIIIIIAIALFFISFWIIKKIIKAIFLATAVLAIVLVVTGYFVVQDVNDLQENFQTSPKLILLVDNNTLLTGFSSDASAEPIKSSEIEAIRQAVQQENFKAIPQEYYKTVVYSKESLESLNDIKIKIADRELTKEQAMRVVLDVQFATAMSKELFINNAEELRVFVFSTIINDYFTGEQGNNFINGLQQGTIMIYPETITFKLIKVIPSGLISNLP